MDRTEMIDGYKIETSTQKLCVHCLVTCVGQDNAEVSVTINEQDKMIGIFNMAVVTQDECTCECESADCQHLHTH